MAAPLSSPRFTATWYATRQRRTVAVLLGITLLVSGMSALLIIQFEFIPVAALYAVVVLISLVARPRWGLYLVLGLMLLFEMSSVYDSLMWPGWFLHGSLDNTVKL